MQTEAVITINKEVVLLMPDVLKITGFSRSSIYRLIDQADFPKPFKLGLKTIAWRESSVYNWINDRASQNV